MNKKYCCLRNQEFSNGNYSIVPIRYQDRFDIMKWRNEQLYHLRQAKPLTKEDQENYFNHIIAGLFTNEKTPQLLFSYLDGDKCIGYGGLVHMNWIDKNAEISFVLNTALEKDTFDFHWTTYLELIEELAYSELQLHKLYVYAFDLRPHLYAVLEKNNFFKDAVLKEHCFFDNEYIDVIIHSKLNDNKCV